MPSQKENLLLKRASRILFSPAARRGLILAFLGSTIVALMETASMAAIAPLIALILGTPLTNGPLQFVEPIFRGASTETIIATLGIIAVSGFLLKDIATIFFRWWMLMFVSRQQSLTSARLLEYYLKAPFRLHLDRSSADLLRTMGTSVGQVFNYSVLGLLNAATEAISVLLIGTMLLIVIPIPTLIALAYFAIAALLFDRFLKPFAVRVGRQKIDAQAAGYMSAFHALGGAKEIKLRGAEDRFIDDYRTIELTSARATGIASFLAELPKYLLEILFIAGIAITFAFSFSNGAGSDIFVTLALLGAGGFRILPSLSRIVSSLSNIRVGGPALLDVVLELEAAAQLTAGPRTPEPAPLPFNSSLRAEAVSFRFGSEGPDVLKGINLDIPLGSSIALVGASGAGKSTMVDMILGFHHATEGKLTVDGQEIGPLTTRAWQKNLAMVPQDVYLLNATLRQNIVFDSDDFDPDRLNEAITRAQLQNFVDSLEEGIETVVGERGSRLSGGQKQRIGIARALYRRPKLLVLDEATSALDNETEHHIAETIRGLQGEITVVIVAHRLSTVRDADNIVYLRNGEIEATGTFQELKAASPDFARQVALGTLTNDEPRAAKGPSNG